MKICVFVLIFRFWYVYSEDDNRGDLSNGDNDFPVSKLPVDVQSDLINILNGSVDAYWGICSGTKPDLNKVEFLLYTNDTEVPMKLNPKRPSRRIDFNAPLFLLTHGWLSGTNGYQMNAFRDKYIELYGKNIIFINWGQLAWYPYTLTYCNIQFIARQVAEFLCKLNIDHEYDLSNVHMIGHSFGGQLSGLTGKAVEEQCETKIGRITALDPAGPIYSLLFSLYRLAPTDAEFVDVVHSNSGLLGYMRECGTVDYHLNGGVWQPGCTILNDLNNIAEYSVLSIVCSHMRSVEMWPYVLESNQFKGKSCSQSLMICVPHSYEAKFTTMGSTNVTPDYRHYSVLTRPRPPFHLGCKPYPDAEGCE